MGKSAPAPPRPKDTSAAQTSTNVGTAIANAMLGNVNENTPYGSLTYEQTGTHTWNDPYTRKTYDIPTFTSTQTLSPDLQQTNDNLIGMARDQSGMLREHLAKPIDLSNEATEARLMELGRSRLDPLLAERRDSEATRLANQGVRLGSTAYDRAMRGVNEGENDAYNQLLLQGRGQAIQEAITERTQPINEITALLSGTQVAQPNFLQPNMPQVPTTDVAGIINQNYNQRLAAWQQNQAGVGSAIGALGGLFALSDERTKKDKEKITDLDDDGTGLWAFRYKSEDDDAPKHIGLMAQEVESVDPSAVITGPDGFKRVNYDRAMGSILGGA